MQSIHSADQLASLIRFHRKRAGLSQVDLAEIASVSRKVVQALEAGKEGTSWGNLVAVLEVLNINLQPNGPLIGEWVSETEETDSGKESS